MSSKPSLISTKRSPSDVTSCTSMGLVSSSPYHGTSCLPLEVRSKNRKVEHIADVITQVHKLYLQHGFKITRMHTDCEFEPLRKEMTALGINLNCVSKKKHVPTIERFIRTVKERVRSARATMPFNRISKLMIVHLVASDIHIHAH